MSRYRHEYKYMIDTKEEALLLLKSSALMQKDKYAKGNGKYQITSLYFDDYQNSCFYDNESGVDPRSKFRIRYYNDDSENLRLEKKSKCNGMTRKESCIITRDQCFMLMNGMIPDAIDDLDGTQRSLFYEMRIRKMMPKVIVSYDRVPFVFSAGNVRVTFDKNITSSDDISAFLDGTFSRRPIMGQGMSILEVKWDEFLPLHIKEIIQNEKLQWITFSKYYLCRKYNLNGGLK